MSDYFTAISQSGSVKNRLLRQPSWLKLFSNHLDAWGVSLIVAGLVLLTHRAITWSGGLLLLAIGLGYWLAFALNDYYDASSDAQDPVKADRNFFVDQAISPRRLLAILLGIKAFLLLAFTQFGLKGFLTLIVCFAVMWAYSAPPLRLKSRPGLDLLTHALFVETFPYLICLLLLDLTWSPLDNVLLSLAMLISLTAQLEQQLRDFEVDSKTEFNFTRLVGRETASRLLKGITLIILLIFFGYLVSGIIPLMLAPLGLLGLPLALHRFFRPPDQPRSEKLVAAITKIGLLYTAALILYTV